jgi:hypothetical protein
MPQLFLHVHNRGATLDQQGTEGMPQIMQPNFSNSRLGQHRQEVAVVKVVGIEKPPSGPWNTKSSVSLPAM